MSILARQLEAYNRHDLDGFMAYFAPDAWIENGEGQLIAGDIAAIRERYRNRFEANPALHSALLNRIAVGSFIIDDEHLTGFADGSNQHVVLIYRIEHDLIASVRFLS